MYNKIVAIGSVGVLLAMIYFAVQEIGTLKAEKAQAEHALENMSEAMQVLNARYQMAEKRLAENRQTQQVIKEQEREQTDAIHSSLSGVVCADAYLPDAIADRLRIITGADSDNRSASAEGAD